MNWFGAVTLPDLIVPNRPAYELLHAANGIGANTLFAVALLHFAAALKHHFVDRGNVLRRMLPVRLRSREEQRNVLVD